MRFVPAEQNAGVVFVRKDNGAETARIPCAVENVDRQDRRTVLANGSVTVETVEHVLSAVAGLEIDNLEIEVDGPEIPSIDGSPGPFVRALREAGIREQQADREIFVIDEPVCVSAGGATLAALPGPSDCLELLYELHYEQSAALGRQMLSFRLGKDDYAEQIAPARTFLLEAEARQLQAAGIGTHLTARDVLVVGPDGVMDNELRFADEPVRHKLADLIGDLTLVGQPLAGRIVAARSGHELNQALAGRLRETIDQQHIAQALAGASPPMDIHKVMELLPHRYPFLMVDRVVEMDGDRRAVAIKNVTINEPFFQGHYPGQPIMPGVMILEALAQLSGLLLSRRLELGKKVAVLLSMDHVKMRRPVRPGDQLLLEAESVRVRSRTGHCRCRARVGDEIVAEVEIKFMLVDPEAV